MRRLTLTAMAAIVLATGMAGCSIIKAAPPQIAHTGTLQGIITGPSGPVPNAAIDVTASDATVHSGASNADGYYSIASIPVGPATYLVRASGFANASGAITIVPDPQANRQDVSLNPQ